VIETLVEIHSWLRWPVLAALLGGGGWALIQAPRNVAFSRTPFSVCVAVIDVQVLVGLVVYLANAGWSEGWFVAIVHPLTMLVAAGLAHAGVAKGAREGGTRAYQLVGVAFLLALAVVALGIPWDRAEL
jgi:hypothetical protein